MSCSASGNLDVAIHGWVPPVVDPTKGAKGKGSDIHEILEKASMLSASDLENVIKSLQYFTAIAKTRRFKHLAEEMVEVDWLPSKPRTIVDRVLYLSDEIHIFDWKTGRIFVDVNNNDQMMYYALTYAYLASNAKGVWVHIVQPWADNMESRFITTNELAAFKARALEAEAKVQSKVIEFHVTDHCKFCPAFPHSRGDKGRPLCPEAMHVLYPMPLDEDAILEGIE
jgi:hypothetical protein